MQGLPEGETRVTCTACAGTLLLEFGLLSRLTEDPEYEEKARNAAVQVYSEPRACHTQGYQYRSKSMIVALFCKIWVLAKPQICTPQTHTYAMT